jgi:pimeloyl-ACP methyl ester carboxylesterase
MVMSLSQQELDMAGCRTRILRGGQGEPLVFFHGEDAPPERLQAFLEPLAREFDVIAPVHPGFGGTSLPAGWNSVDDLVYHYLDLLDALGLTRVNIAGQSLGGWIAAELAAGWRERVKKLALVNAIGIKVEGIILTNLFMIPSARMAEMRISDPAVRAAIAPKTAEDRAAILYDKEASARFLFQKLYHPKLRARLARATSPTLVLWGAKNGLLPLDYGRAYAAAISGAKFATLPGGQDLANERPAETASMLAKFFKEGH